MATDSQSTENLFEFQKSLLTQEIEYIHSQIGHFDDLSFQIKGWAITIWAAISAFGSSQTTVLVILASIPAMLAFWTLDAYFKQYQRRYMARMGAIEMFLDSKEYYDSPRYFHETGLKTAFEHKDFGSFPIHDPIGARTRWLGSEFERHYRDATNYWKAFSVPNVAYYYLFLILSSVVISVILA
jgi:hypothetical protein